MDFERIEPMGPSRPVVAHVPHAATHIPDAVRADIVLDDAELQAELLRLTDWHTDRLFDGVLRHGASMFVNRLSRLVFDPERFADAMAEPMEAVGQGVVYTRTTSGGLLRQVDAAARTRTLRELYDPYHAALTDLVAERLAACGPLHRHRLPLLRHAAAPQRAGPVPASPRRLHRDRRLPYPSPSWPIRYRAPSRPRASGSPSTGPSPERWCHSTWYRRDRRVRAVMIEVRRGLYCDEATGVENASFEQVRAAIERALLRGGAFD